MIKIMSRLDERSESFFSRGLDAHFHLDLFSVAMMGYFRWPVMTRNSGLYHREPKGSPHLLLRRLFFVSVIYMQWTRNIKSNLPVRLHDIQLSICESRVEYFLH